MHLWLKRPTLCICQCHSENKKQNNTAVDFTSPKTKEESRIVSLTGTFCGGMDSEHKVAMGMLSSEHSVPSILQHCSEDPICWHVTVDSFRGSPLSPNLQALVRSQSMPGPSEPLLSITWTMPPTILEVACVTYNVEICHSIQSFQGIQGAIVL